MAADTRPDSGILARVTDKIYQGTTVLLDIEIPGIDTVRAERPTSEASRINIGQTANIVFEQAHAVPRIGS